MKGRKPKRPGHEEGDNSLSSLGSLPETRSVAKLITEDFPSQRRMTLHHQSSASRAQRPSVYRSTARRGETSSRPSVHRSTAHRGEASSQRHKDHPRSPSGADDDSGPRECPHCKKAFSNGWAIPKHVIVRYYRVKIYFYLRHHHQYSN